MKIIVSCNSPYNGCNLGSILYSNSCSAKVKQMSLHVTDSVLRAVFILTKHRIWVHNNHTTLDLKM